MKAVGMFTQGIAAYDSGKYTRSVMATNAQNAQNAGVMERDRVREAARIAMGEQLNAQGSSGFDTGTGSALDALHQSAINRELDLTLSRAKASGAAAGFKQQGDIAYAQGKAAMAGGIISGAAEIASEIAGAFGGMPSGGGGSIGTPPPSSPGSINVGSGTSSYFNSHPFGS